MALFILDRGFPGFEIGLPVRVLKCHHPSSEQNVCLRPGWGGAALPLAGPGEEQGLPAVGTGLPPPAAARLPQAQPRPVGPESPGRQHARGRGVAVQSRLVGGQQRP